jgi:hypothetical protein
METTYNILADDNYGEASKTIVIALTLGGGLIQALIGIGASNKAMVKTLAGKRDAEEDDDPKNIRCGKSFDPTLMETKYCPYPEDLGTIGLDWTFLCLCAVCIQTHPLADIVGILWAASCQYCWHPMGRIGEVTTPLANWWNLPLTEMPSASLMEPPMLPSLQSLQRPNDPKMGLPIGGKELKAAEIA